MKLQFNVNRQYSRNPTTEMQTSSSFRDRLIAREQILERLNASMQQSKVNIEDSTVKPSSENTKSRWGPSTWYLFHTLSQKIKPENFDTIKNEFLDMVKSICLNLPCPACAQHATQYMQNLNYNSIKNKDDLKIFFLNFHNMVNERSKKPLLTINELNDKYSKAKTMNVIKNFIGIFQQKNKSFNMIANEMQRQRQVEIYKDWFNKNYQLFEP